MTLFLTAIAAGLILLVWSADRFIDGASALAKNLGISPMLIGLTIVGFGTSAPEILVSSMAALNGNPGLSIGNALGSNIANIGLILGITALVSPILVKSATLKREYPILLFVSLATLVLMLDGHLGVSDGILFLLLLIVVLGIIIKIGLSAPKDDPLGQEAENDIPNMSQKIAIVWFIIGLCVLIASSKLLVWGAVGVAQAFGISELVIGLTIIALGTSLPELAAGISSALKNEHDLALGNIIGSNIYNLLAVLAAPALIAPGPFSPDILLRDMPTMLGLTLLMFFLAYGFRKQGKINRVEGSLLVMIYLAYQGVLFYQNA